MAWVISRSLVKAEVSNHIRGRVTGKLWLYGQQDPIELEFDGNAGPDIAGCRILIENPSPEPGERIHLNKFQVGTIKECTASHRISTPLVSPYEARRLRQEGKPTPTRLDNGFRLAWTSQTDGDVVVEGAGYSIFTSTSGWPRRKPAARSSATGGGGDTQAAPMRTDAPTPSTLGFDEHAWERMLRSTDDSNALYLKLLEKYAAEPDRDQRIAREMGWPLPEAQKPVPPVSSEAPPEGLLLPLPEKHGTDWIVTFQGDIAHPLADQALRLSVNVRRECRRLLVADDSREQRLTTFADAVQNVACKLAGALNNLAYDKVVDCGFIVAYLKRGIAAVHEALAALENLAIEPWFPRDLAERCRNEIHALREAALKLSHRFRDD